MADTYTYNYDGRGSVSNEGNIYDPLTIYSSLIEMQQDEFMKQREEYLKGNQEAMLSGIEGMASSIIGGVVGLVGGTAWGLGKEIKEDAFSYGYWDFNERFVNPTLQSIRDNTRR